MRAVKSDDTKPEMIVRKAIHRKGFRYRLHDKKLPGKPDLVFPRYKTVVFVHGCFWHWHGCPRSRMPKSNTEYWEKKIGRNTERDKTNKKALENMGWKVLIIWECSLESGVAHLLASLRENMGD